MFRSFLCVVLLSLLLPTRAMAGRVEAVSVPAAPASSATAKGSLAGNSSAVSNDGRWIVFVSDAANLVPGQVDPGSTNDVFLRDRVAGTTVLVSRAITGANVAASGTAPRISADGSVVAFFSAAGNLVPGQSNPGNFPRLHLFERSTGKIQLVTPTNAAVRGLNEGCALSGDGRWLVYNMASSQAALDPQHIYLFDRFTGQSTLVDRSAAAPGQPSNGSSLAPKISGDGRYIAFPSSSTNILGDQLGAGAFLYDRIANQTTRVTDAAAQELRLSADGRWLAFLSRDGDVIAGQSDGNPNDFDIFLWDRVTHEIILVSRSTTYLSPGSTGSSASSWSHQEPGHETSFAENVISADGRWIAFFSTAEDITGKNPGSTSVDVYLFDRTTGQNVMASVSIDDAFMEASWGLALSADGSRLAYTTENLYQVPGLVDAVETTDLFLYNTATRARELASRSMSSATTATGAVQASPQISADGRVAVFGSGSADLVANDLTGDNVFAYVIANPGQLFHELTPCRLFDSRQTGPVLFSEVPRKVAATGSCGVPSTARSLAVTVTVVQPSGMGRLAMQPGDVSAETSSVNFPAGQTLSNHATLGLAFDGSGTLSLTPKIVGGGSVHVTLDVLGYYE